MKSQLSISAGLLLAAAAWAGAAAEPGLAADDSIITAKVKSALIGEPTGKARQIKVKTVHGVVRLSGFVDTSVAKQRAEVIASTTEGVTDVEDNLKIR